MVGKAQELETAKEILGEFSLVVTTNFRIRAKSELLACRFQAHHYGYLELPVVTPPCLCHVNHSFRRYPLTHCLLGWVQSNGPLLHLLSCLSDKQTSRLQIS